MKVFFDHGTPAPLQAILEGHSVRQAKAESRDTLGNGELLAAAKAAGFKLLITTDKNIRYQQNLTRRRIAILVLGNPQWPVLRLHVERVVAAVQAAGPGSFVEVTIPE